MNFLCVKVIHVLYIKCSNILHYGTTVFFAYLVYLYVYDMFHTLLSF
jgi:hypothetical protein